MSFTDQQPEAQPGEGQGDGGTSDAPYAEYLNRIPEEYREDVEPVFREWDANVTRRFQDNANFRKSFEPYQQMGLDQMSPDEVQWALDFRNAAENDPSAIQEWFQEYSQQRGLQVEQQQVQEDPFNGDYSQFNEQQQFEKLLEERLGPLQSQLKQYEDRFNQISAKDAEAEAGRFIDGQLAELEKKYGEDFNREMAETFSARYHDSDPMNAIPRGYEDYIAFKNQVEKSALNPKVDAPAPAEGGGVPDISVSTPKRVDAPEVRQAAMEFLKNNRRA